MLLGAGASRGADFGFRPICDPPLNRDFFTQLQRITGKHGRLVRDVIRDVVRLFGANFDLTLEDYFSQLEFLIFTADRQSVTKPTGGELRAMRDRLMAALSAVLEVSTVTGAISGRGARGCTYHTRLAADLKPGDHVISFNYDCVMDDALRRAAGGRWHASSGYGFPRRYTVDPSGAAFWSPAGIRPPSSIKLLKLHGSVHWQLPRDVSTTVTLKQRLHQQNGTPRFDIIPPQWNKSVATPVFRQIWRSAFRAIEQADRIAVIGFSFTATDLHVESLFRLALNGAPLKTLIIANPSSADRERVRRVFASCLARTNAVVREYEGLSDFVRVWPTALDA